LWHETPRIVGGLLLYTLAGEPFGISAQQDGTVRVPLRFFTEAEARLISVIQAGQARLNICR
jgi:hypothetical protein